MSESELQNEKFALGELVIGRYRILEEIGSGAMATVYRCEDTNEENKVIALKILSASFSDDETMVARFKNELKISKSLVHPNIVQNFDFGQTEKNRYFITMEYLPNGSMGNLIEREGANIPVDRLLQLLVDVAAGLYLAHQAGIVHRDLKPDNILLTAELRGAVSDFGLARSMESDLKLTKSGETVGTPCYMAPEQFRGEEVDARTDIYSYGILAYELACGQRPFLGETYHAIATAHMLNPIPEISEIRNDIPRWYQEFVELCSTKLPKDRFQSMGEILSELHDRQNFRGSIERVKRSASGVLRVSLKMLGLSKEQ